MDFKSQNTKEAFDEMIILGDQNPNIQKINYSENSGVIIFVYDLGNFLYSYFDKIKDKPISILQIPLTPFEIKETTELGSLTERKLRGELVIVRSTA